MTPTNTDNPIVKVARDLTEIDRCHAELRAQAIATGDNPDLPGGAAMVALAPVADLETWGYLNDATETYGRSYTSEPDEEPEEQRWPPQQLIGYWAGEWRRLRGEDYPGLCRTFASDLNYIRNAIGWAAQHDTARWTRFTADIRHARLTIENIVAEGRRADRSRIICDRDHCEKKPRLIRTYSPRYLTGWTCTTCETHTPAEYRCIDHNHPARPGAGTCTRMTGPKKLRVPCHSELHAITPEPPTCFNPRCASFDEPEPVYASDPEADGWKCPACKHRYTDRELQRAHAHMLWRPEAERWVRIQEAVATLRSQGRGERTIRRWLSPRLELVDRCLECSAIWEHQEYPACPAELPPEEDGGEPEPCGGLLEERWHGDGEAVVEGWCDIATHTTWLWWPDLWRLHLTTRTTPREKGMMAS